MTVALRPLTPQDDRSAFHSGNIDLDRFFHRFAGQNQFKHHLGSTWVAVEASEILGYVTLSPCEVRGATLARVIGPKMLGYPLPALRLTRLAVAAQAQGRGIGSDLMWLAFKRTRLLAAEFGCIGLIVDSKPESIGFYERFGFLRLTLVAGELGDRPAPIPMFLELGAIPGAPG